ncbi:hypothetical protein RchiOBHm_Chr6g0303141 [Rosa chinensis]|uniref:Uncharacterized protein n=1 Tax=Rosa chinensis TaxID=74649 RepID=A0A2P6PZ88_ROSCH|nr:hypothetical protein RchiOBHm_Chr6g0303141 [Rosa chinensis]
MRPCSPRICLLVTNDATGLSKPVLYNANSPRPSLIFFFASVSFDCSCSGTHLLVQFEVHSCQSETAACHDRAHILLMDYKGDVCIPCSAH